MAERVIVRVTRTRERKILVGVFLCIEFIVLVGKDKYQYLFLYQILILNRKKVLYLLRYNIQILLLKRYNNIELT